jgi:hypothetical protein
MSVKIGRTDVSGAFAHDAYLRLSIDVSATAQAIVPCPKPQVPQVPQVPLVSMLAP